MFLKRTVLAVILLGGLLLPAAAQAAPQEGALHPPIEPFKTGYLKVSGIHEIYYELCGNPEGKPVFFLHGGPGVGCYPRMRQYLDPEKFLMVLHDQRGAGRSRPHGELRENTTWELVADIERLRMHLEIERFMIFGGSWGTTLGLAYAEAYPRNVTGMILRGVFTGTAEEVEQHYMGTRWFYPEEHAALMAALPDPDRRPLPDYLLELSRHEDEKVRMRVLNALARYESKFMKLEVSDEEIEGFIEAIPDDVHARVAGIDLFYVTNQYFLDGDQLVREAGKLKDIPVTLIVGRYDMASPALGAYRIHEQLPQSKLVIVEKAGHSESEEGITAALVEAGKVFE